MKRAVVYAALTAAVFVGLAGGLPSSSAQARLADSRSGELASHPRIHRCAERHPWERVGHRQRLIWCVAHAFNGPGTPRTAIAVARCESGDDFQDIDGSDGHIGTFQHVTSSWPGRWRTWGQAVGVRSSPTNVLSQAVVSVRMAIVLGTWNSSAGWAGCA